jgi:hypothetical protein
MISAKKYEEAEANAIGTEYLRADLLPAGCEDPAVRRKPLSQERETIENEKRVVEYVAHPNSRCSRGAATPYWTKLSLGQISESSAGASCTWGCERRRD